MISSQLSFITYTAKTATKCVTSIPQALLKTITTIVFKVFDILDCIFCIVFGIIDHLLEGKNAFPCCCSGEGDDVAVSETLFGDGVRRNMLRKMMWVMLRRWGRSFREWKKESENININGSNRWSDCGCEGCMSWINGCLNGCDFRLHVAVQQPQITDMLPVSGEDHTEQSTENVILLHGFVSSTSFWSEGVFPNLSEEVKNKYKLFAVDLLGFGKSPKPRSCLYTLKDHMEMVEKSVIIPFELNSFHIVAHSMGCIIAIALAAKYPNSVKTVTLVAPPCFTTPSDALQKLAGKRLWPPMVFGASFMSWYEHLGRLICFIACRNHRILESILRFLTWRSGLSFMILDFPRHTHHAFWYTMHNVVCGGAKFMDEYMDILRKTRIKLTVIQGENDLIVPPQCRSTIKKKVPEAEIRVLPDYNHISVVLNRAKEFTEILQGIWSSCK